ncbi:SIS domain protein [Lysobacter capsici]|uniref:SIS domain-containing protein n=1 Tax=Lysobacter capsici TaxID=435897 RepID=UPI00071642AA|nr:SIS domain-containing protein [Lysobacter capsici]ALN84842.1 SIS domain protein [Lysobacter capsici]WND82108.1 SIS domain-containing protein [Lysobacter capsici]WND87303.1 SIS domain-containing protein [Lysobacter capsici]
MDLTPLPDSTAWQRLGGADTAAEIAQQPALWGELARDLAQARERVQAFLGDCLDDPRQRVLFTGAGSSGFIADLVADAINAQWPAEVRALHTTNLLTHPALYLQRDRPTLLVSFGRSGSSPESVAAVELVRAQVEHARFLDITCNPQGELARRGAGRDDTCTVLMPAASCDRAFAMTSSLSCMLLAALSVFDRAPWPRRIERLQQLAELAREGLAQWDAPVAALAQRPFNRVIYLASGPLEALAREAALKVLELTAGRVLALANTPLGFRHGPKSTLDGETLVVVMRSNHALARRYEHDLLDELRRDGVAGQVLSIGPHADIGGGDDYSLRLPPQGDSTFADSMFSDGWLTPVWLTFAQMYALQRSAALGLTPDNPFPDGTVNRVVKGVTIHHG